MSYEQKRHPYTLKRSSLVVNLSRMTQRKRLALSEISKSPKKPKDVPELLKSFKSEELVESPKPLQKAEETSPNVSAKMLNIKKDNIGLDGEHMTNFKEPTAGCLTCRQRHKKCSRTSPVCQTCLSNRYECYWREPGTRFSDYKVPLVHTDSPRGITLRPNKGEDLQASAMNNSNLLSVAQMAVSITNDYLTAHDMDSVLKKTDDKEALNMEQNESIAEENDKDTTTSEGSEDEEKNDGNCEDDKGPTKYNEKDSEGDGSAGSATSTNNDGEGNSKDGSTNSESKNGSTRETSSSKSSTSVDGSFDSLAFFSDTLEFEKLLKLRSMLARGERMINNKAIVVSTKIEEPDKEEIQIQSCKVRANEESNGPISLDPSYQPNPELAPIDYSKVVFDDNLVLQSNQIFEIENKREPETALHKPGGVEERNEEPLGPNGILQQAETSTSDDNTQFFDAPEPGRLFVDEETDEVFPVVTKSTSGSKVLNQIDRSNSGLVHQHVSMKMNKDKNREMKNVNQQYKQIVLRESLSALKNVDLDRVKNDGRRARRVKRHVDVSELPSSITQFLGSASI